MVCYHVGSYSLLFVLGLVLVVIVAVLLIMRPYKLHFISFFSCCFVFVLSLSRALYYILIYKNTLVLIHSSMQYY